MQSKLHSSDIINTFSQQTSTASKKIHELADSLCGEKNKINVRKQIKKMRNIVQQSQACLIELKQFYEKMDLEFAFTFSKDIFNLMTLSLNSMTRMLFSFLKKNERNKVSQEDWHIITQQIQNQTLEFDDLNKQQSQIVTTESPTTTILSEMINNQIKVRKDSNLYQEFNLTNEDILVIKNSQKIGETLIQNFLKDGKSKLGSTSVKLAKIYYHYYIQEKEERLRTCQMQTDDEDFESLEGLKVCIFQQEKKIQFLEDEKQIMRDKFRLLEESQFNLRKKVEQLEEKISNHFREISQAKAQNYHELRKKEDQIAIMKKRISFLEEEKNKNDQADQIVEEAEGNVKVEETNKDQSDLKQPQWALLLSNKKSNSRIQKQLLNQKKQNFDFRLSLQLILSVMKENEMINYDPTIKFKNDVAKGRFSETARMISEQLRKQIEKIKSRFFDRDDSLEKSMDGKAQIGIQTEKQKGNELTDQGATQAVTPMNGSFDGGNKNNGNGLLDPRAFQREREGLRRDSTRRSKMRTSRNKMSKLVSNFDKQNADKLFSRTNPTMNMSSLLNNSYSRTAKPHQNTQNLNLCFEQILIKKQDKQFKDQKRLNLMNTKQFDDFTATGTMLGVEGLETRSEANKIFKYLDSRNDVENKFLRRFMRYLFDDMRRKKGVDFLNSILSDNEKKKKIINKGQIIKASLK